MLPPHRATTRLRYHDYTQGVYFVTICTYRREPLFGYIRDARVAFSEYGRIVEEQWLRIENLRANVQLDAWIIMPDHIHGVIVLHEVPQLDCTPASAPRRFGPPVPGSLQTIVGMFKTNVTTRINTLRRTPGAQVWQSRFYDHVVRDAADLDRIRQYIATNPARWPP